jgi:hypothetical protein
LWATTEVRSDGNIYAYSAQPVATQVWVTGNFSPSKTYDKTITWLDFYGNAHGIQVVNGFVENMY